MPAREDLSRIAQLLQEAPDDPAYLLDLGDAEPILAVVRLASTWSTSTSGAPVDTADPERFARKLDELIAVDEGAGDVASIVRTFAPFAAAADVVAHLDAPGGGTLRASRDVRDAVTYRDAVAATWGAAAALIAGMVASGAGAEAIEREIIAVFGVCALPIALLAFSLDAEDARRLLGGVWLVLEETHRRLAGGRPAHPQLRALQADLDGLVRRKQAQVRALAGDLPRPDAATGHPVADQLDALAYVGALLELRGESTDLGDDLAGTVIPKNKLVSHLSRMGITDPILIDQNPQLAKLAQARTAADEWITEALALAARDPKNAGLAHAVDRTAVMLGAIRTRLTMIQITERLIEDGEYELWEELKDTADVLDTAVMFLIADADFEHVRQTVVKASANASLLVRSHRWSRLVLQAMKSATDVILMLETGGRMGGVGPSLQLARAGGGVQVVAGAAELDALLAGATVVAMASRRDPQKGRRKGIKAEKGLGLSPDRPRDSIPSITGTADVRHPDRLLLRFRTFWEVKNVARLRLTSQMTDFILYAQSTGMKLVLYVRPRVAGGGTTLAPALADALKILRRQGLLQIRYLKIY